MCFIAHMRETPHTHSDDWTLIGLPAARVLEQLLNTTNKERGAAKGFASAAPTRSAYKRRAGIASARSRRRGKTRQPWELAKEQARPN